jgi:hypothetical protein
VSVDEVVAAPDELPFREPWRDAPTDDEREFYRLKKSHIVVRRADDHRAVAVLDLVSAGDKASRRSVTTLVERAVGLLRKGVNLLVVDLLPPNHHAPSGIHSAIWERICGEPFELPPDQALTLAAYSAGGEIAAYVEPVAVGDALPDMPIFLTPDRYVPCPLEATYQSTWDVFPAVLKGPLEGPGGSPTA